MVSDLKPLTISAKGSYIFNLGLNTALVLGFSFYCCILEPNILYIDQKNREAIFNALRRTSADVTVSLFN